MAKRVKVTKKEYKEKFEQRGRASKKRDSSRRHYRKKVLSGDSEELPEKWDTKKYDWEGVDAKKYRKISSEEKKQELTGGIPESCKIVKFVPSKKKGKKGKASPMYQPICGGKKIGPLDTPTKLKDAKIICNVWEGRRTGMIRNRNLEEEFMRGVIMTRRESLRPDLLDTQAYNPAEFDDPGIRYTERLRERKKRKTALGVDPYIMEAFEYRER